MKKIFAICILMILSCKKENTAGTVRSIPKDSTENVIEDIQTEDSISGDSADFDGDGSKETATVVLTKKGEGNPIEDGIPDEYSVTFSGKKLPALPIGCCEAVIIIEGDLDNDGANEFSVVQSPMNGCVYSMTTYSLKKGKWHQLIEPFLIPTGCEEISAEELESRVFTENGKMYIMETDEDNENFKTVKTEVELLQI